MRLFRRLIGFLIFIASLIGLAISAGLIYFSNIALDSIEGQVGGLVGIVTTNLDTTTEALISVKGTVEEVNDSVATLSTTATSLSDSVTSTEPLFDEVKTVVTSNVPESLEAVQDTIPNIVQVAGTIDDTLGALSGFGFSEKFFGREIKLDLGIDYDPDQRFDDSMQELGNSLDGLPEAMRELSEDLDNTYNSLEAVSVNIDTLAADLDDINAQVETIPPLIDEYLASINGINNQLSGLDGSFDSQMGQIRLGIMIAAIWFAILQLAPLVVGLQLMIPSRDLLDGNDLEQITAGVRAELAKIKAEEELNSDHTLEMPN